MSDRQLISSGSPYEQSIGFSRAVRLGDRVIVSGTAPIREDGRCDEDPESQARRCLQIIDTALTAAGATMSDVVRTRTYIVNRADAEAVARVHGEFLSEVRPASTMVLVAGLLEPEWKVEMEAEAVVSANIQS
ncbi:MAG TPA: RidA family protein [Acidimicrobiales bacterium]|nr:RidA family protein [Acidimicrobiales bacterium]